MMIVLLWLCLFLEALEGFPLPRNIDKTVHSCLDVSAIPEPYTVQVSETFIAPPVSSSDTSDDTEGDDEAVSYGYPSPLHKIHILPLLSDDEAKNCCQIAIDYAASTGRWQNRDFARHETYATCDFPVEDCEAFQGYLEEIDFDGRLWEAMSQLYDVEYEDMTYLDLFVAHYEAKDESTEANVMDYLEAHRDGSLLSFSLLLNPPSEFVGGGTFYDALRDVEPSGVLHEGGVIRPNRAGDAVLHCGKLLHGADTVTGGNRTVLVGFIEVSGRCVRRGVQRQACTDFGRMDAALYRYKRQQRKGHGGWVLKNDHWISGSANLKGFVPAFDSAIRRARPEYQRQKKLEAEDILLREILLPINERSNEIYEGDITILEDDET